MLRKFIGALCLLVCVLGLCESRADPEIYDLGNASVQNQTRTRPQIILRDGRAIDPFVYVPEGWVQTNTGSLITEEGVIVHQDGRIEVPFDLPDGYQKKADGSIVTPEGLVVTPKAEKKNETYPKGTQLLPDGTVVLPNASTILPDGKKVAEPRLAKEQVKENVPPEDKKVPKLPLAKEQTQERVVVLPETDPLWRMLPLTTVADKNQPDKNQPKNVKGSEPKKEEKAQPKPLPAKRPQENPAKETPAKEPTPAKKRVPKMGEELRIPPEAAKSGNLDFLEGCWQGTRPEYYSKRTVYECFCFGKNGGSGKRRVIDPIGRRRCVGATRARLSGSTLLVSSQGAVCSDGERWGQAEMTCRGRGNHTPCSWVFQDANGGRQSYEIPFMRVQSCGRR